MVEKIDFRKKIYIKHGFQDLKNSFSKLKFIDLSNNNLDTLPPSLSTCETLESLILTNNALTTASFPRLSHLHNLHVFDASHNNLDKIPKSLTSRNLSHKLHTIILTHNNIDEIPNSLVKLKALKDLKMDENKLKEVPTVLASLPKLKFLDISNNSFSEPRFSKLANDKRAKLSAIIALAKKLGKPIEEEREEAEENTVEKEAPSDETPAENSPVPLPLQIRTGVENLTVKRHPSVSEIRPYLVIVPRFVNRQSPFTSLYRLPPQRLQQFIQNKREIWKRYDIGVLEIDGHPFPPVLRAENAEKPDTILDILLLDALKNYQLSLDEQLERIDKDKQSE
uniref:Uncharacterized protein n=1 Tax=Caenorhabditis japonica TaxID=281687 RepID=A0A8R1J155_CAEJA